MTLKSLKILLAATALGAGALAYSGPADARVRGRTHYGWHYGWYKGWHRGPVVASDYDVAPRRARHHHDDCVLVDRFLETDHMRQSALSGVAPGAALQAI